MFARRGGISGGVIYVVKLGHAPPFNCDESILRRHSSSSAPLQPISEAAGANVKTLLFKDTQAEMFAQRTFLGTCNKIRFGMVNGLYFIQRY